MKTTRYELLYMGNMIASGSKEDILEFIMTNCAIHPDQKKMNESLESTGEFVYYSGFYRIHKIKNA